MEPPPALIGSAWVASWPAALPPCIRYVTSPPHLTCTPLSSAAPSRGHMPAATPQQVTCWSRACASTPLTRPPPVPSLPRSHMPAATNYTTDGLKPCMRHLLALQRAAHSADDYSSPYLAGGWVMGGEGCGGWCMWVVHVGGGGGMARGAGPPIPPTTPRPPGGAVR